MALEESEVLTRMVRMEEGLSSVAKAIEELKTSMQTVLREVQRVGELEIKHQNSNEAIGRAFAQIEKLETRLEAVESRVNSLDGKELLNSKARAALWLGAMALVGMFLNGVWQSSVYIQELKAEAKLTDQKESDK